jgi:hypothetical protein
MMRELRELRQRVDRVEGQVEQAAGERFVERSPAPTLPGAPLAMPQQEPAHPWKVWRRWNFTSGVWEYAVVDRQPPMDGNLPSGLYAGQVLTPDGGRTNVSALGWTASVTSLWIQVKVEYASITVTLQFGDTGLEAMNLYDSPAYVVLRLAEWGVVNDIPWMRPHVTTAVDLIGAIIPVWFYGFVKAEDQVFTHVAADGKPRWISPEECP